MSIIMNKELALIGMLNHQKNLGKTDKIVFYPKNVVQYAHWLSNVTDDMVQPDFFSEDVESLLNTKPLLFSLELDGSYSIRIENIDNKTMLDEFIPDINYKNSLLKIIFG